jgi:hypothetical protein
VVLGLRREVVAVVTTEAAPDTKCGCCRGPIGKTDAVKEALGLCSECYGLWTDFTTVSPTQREHVLARGLSHSPKAIAKRMGTTASAHQSAVSNAAVRAGRSRGDLIRIAIWALRTGHAEKPAGFEGLSPNGNGEPVAAHARRTSVAEAPLDLPGRRVQAPATPEQEAHAGQAEEERAASPEAAAVDDTPEAAAAPPAPDTPEAAAEVAQTVLTPLPLVIERDALEMRCALAAISAEECRRGFELVSGRLLHLMMQSDALDDVPALMRVAFRYGLALGESRALDSLTR